MNISSIGGASGMTGVTGANQDDFRTRMQQSMAPVAQLFGMSSDDLMSAVKASGGSLADYAASKGISSSDLTSAIKQGLQANAPNGVQLSDSQLTNMAQRIENHKPGDRPQGPPPGTGGVSATDASSTIKKDLEKLIADLKASESTTSSDGTTSSSTSTVKTELEKLIADLKASNSQADSSTTSSTGTNSLSTNALLDVLTRFDQQL